MGRLEGRTALVTGASRGIGRAAALAFADEGCDLFLVARNQALLDEVATEIRARGRTAVTLIADLADLAALGTVAAAVAENTGYLDIFLANAAILGPQKPFADLTSDEWTELFQINVLANFHLLRGLHPLLLRSDAGRVIAMSSYAAIMALPDNAGYSATKAMLESGIRIYAAENAGTPIRANIVNPGGMRTDMRMEFRPDEDPATVPSPGVAGPLFVELAEPALTANGQTFILPEWLKAKG